MNGPAITRPAAEGGIRVWPGTNLPLRGFVLLFLLSVFWGLNWPIMKIGMSAIPVFTFRGGVFLLGGAALLVLCRINGYALRVPRHQWPALGLVTCFVLGFQVLSGYGVLLTGSGRAAVMAYTMPIWSLLFGTAFLREPVTWRRLTSLALATGGMALLIGDEVTMLGGAPLGLGFMIATAILWALATIVQKKVDWGAPTLVLIAWQTVLGTAPLVIGAALTDHSGVTMPGLWPLLAFVYNVGIALVFCFYAYFEVVRLFPVAITTIGVMLTPVVGIFSGAWILGESLGAPEFGALILVVAAIGFPVLTRPRPR